MILLITIFIFIVWIYLLFLLYGYIFSHRQGKKERRASKVFQRWDFAFSGAIIILGGFSILCFLVVGNYRLGGILYFVFFFGVFKYIFMVGFRNLSFLDVGKYHLDGISHFLDVSKYYPGVHVGLQIKHQRGRSNKLNDIAFLVLWRQRQEKGGFIETSNRDKFSRQESSCWDCPPRLSVNTLCTNNDWKRDQALSVFTSTFSPLLEHAVLVF